MNVDNPFRTGTKLFDLFEHMKDGRKYDLTELSNVAYGYGGGWCDTSRRRTGSAIRTIRAKPGFDVRYDPVDKTYQLRITRSLRLDNPAVKPTFCLKNPPAQSPAPVGQWVKV